MSFFAVVHLLAALMFIGWLWQSGRLSASRVHEVRAMFALTEAEAIAAAEQQQAEAAQAAQREIDEQRDANPPIDSASQVRLIGLLKEQEAQSRRRLDAERSLMMQQVAQAQDQMKRKETALDERLQAFDSTHSDEKTRKNDEQFLQAVRQIEQLPPKQGKRVLVELINQNQKDQAVRYLKAMNPRATSKVLREFKTDEEIVVATELLERMRTFGMEPLRSAVADGASASQPGLPGVRGSANAAGTNVPADQ